MSNIVILGDDLLSPEQIQQIAGLDALPELTPCAPLDENDEDDGTSPGCCMVDHHTKTALLLWAKTENKTIKNIFAFVQSKPADTTEAWHFYPVPYFFYGHLSDPKLWTGRLGFEEAPKFVDAEIKGWELKMWGHYRAIVKTKERNKMVKGVMYSLKNKEMLDKIAAYQTDRYCVRWSDMFDDRGYISEGCVFAFAGDISTLKTEEEYELEQRAYRELEAI